jgi:hypothetical protein
MLTEQGTLFVKKPLTNENIPYKTKICTFWEHGRCTRGSVCTFKHGELDPLANLETAPKNKIDTTKQIWILKKPDLETNLIN